MRHAIVPVLVDVSRSMGLPDAGDGMTRIDRARDLLTRELLPRLKQHFQVDVLSFGDRVAAADPEKLWSPNGEGIVFSSTRETGTAISARQSRPCASATADAPSPESS